MTGYLDRVRALSPAAKEYLAEQLGIGAKIEHLVVYYTSVPDDADLLQEVLQKQVEQELPVHMHPKSYVRLADMPRLANGKIDQANLPKLLPSRNITDPHAVIVGDKNDLAYSAEVKTVIGILESLLDFEGILPTDNFFELGGDSITAIRLVSRARDAGVNISVSSVATEADLQSLVAAACEEQTEPAGAPPTAFGYAPLTPIQKWFFNVNHPRPEHWNIGGRVAVTDHTDLIRLRRALECCLAAHPELGVQLHQRDGQWISYYPENGVAADSCRILGSEPGAMASFLAGCAESFSFRDGWMIKFGIVEAQLGYVKELIWTAHHLIVDQLSIQAVLAEIEQLYKNDAAPISSGTGLSMRAWALACETQADQLPEDAQQLSRLTDETGRQSPVYTALKGREKDVVNVAQKLDSSVTARLLGLVDSHDCDLSALLIAALAVAWKNVMGVSVLPLDIEGHGRDLLGNEIDNVRSIGWFSSFYPLDLVLDGRVEETVEFASRVYRQIAQQKKQHGRFLLYGDPSSSSGNNGRVLINFQGSVSTAEHAFFTPLPLSNEHLRAEENYRAHNVEINASVKDGGIRILWALSVKAINQEKIDALTDLFLTYFEQLSHEQLAVPVVGQSAAAGDFPDIDMSQSDLDDFLGSLE